jgi:conjugative relaxase-like TrwC/TraI family protein
LGLSLAKVAPGRQGYYLRSVGAEDGRVEGERAGAWIGAGAADLGLSGRVAPGELDALLAGVDPGSGEILRSRRVGIAAYDLTFCAPKSASVLYGVTGEEAANAIRRGHDKAVEAALGYLERDALRARRGSGAERREVSVAGAIGAGFLHRTSRASDPHLHSHVVVANLARDRDGRWSAIDARGLFWLARTAGFLYEAQLRRELTASLGVGWGEVRNGRSDIAGFGPALLRAFSRRAQQVEARLGEWGASGARAAEAAAIATREPKNPSVSFGALQCEWRERAHRLGLGPAHLEATLKREPHRLHALRGRGPSGSTPAAEAAGPGCAHRMAEVLLGPSGLTRSQSSFSRADVIRGCCELLAGGAAVEEVVAISDEVLRSPLVCRAPGRHGSDWERSARESEANGRAPREREVRTWGPGSQVWSTTEALEVEQRLAWAIDRGRAAARPSSAAPCGAAGREPVGRHTGPAAARRARALEDLPREQAHAVERLVGSGVGIQVVAGSSRRGALDALDAARAVWEASGTKVMGVAPSLRQVAELESMAGIPSVPPGGLVAELEASGLVGPGSVLVVAGAEEIPIRQLGLLVEAAVGSGGGAVLMADPGGAARGRGAGSLLAPLAASGCLDGPKRGAPEEALGAPSPAVRARGEAQVVIGPTLGSVRRQLLSDWWAARASGERVEMVATRARDVAELNARARQALGSAGLLGASVVVDGTELRVGDEVMARRLQGALPGARAAVFEVDDLTGGVTLVTPAGEELRLSARQAASCGLSHSFAVGSWEDRPSQPARALLLGDAALLSYSRWRPDPARDVHYVVGGDQLAPARGSPADATVHEGVALKGCSNERTTEEELDWARRVLARAARASPPRHLCHDIGPLPEGLSSRARWMEAAGAAQLYRERWGVEGPETSIGPRPSRGTVLQRSEWTEAARTLRSAAQELGREVPEPLLGRDLARGLERGPQRRLGAAV